MGIRAYVSNYTHVKMDFNYLSVPWLLTSTVVCSTPLLAPRIGLYTASLVSLKDALIGWSASDYDSPIQLWRIQINTGCTLPSPTWRASPTWRKQNAFPLPGTAALWVIKKKHGNSMNLQRPRTVLCSPTWDVKQSTSTAIWLWMDEQWHLITRHGDNELQIP